jgi:hypothetical protein
VAHEIDTPDRPVRVERPLEPAFAEPERPSFRRPKAVVALYDGRIVAERYALGYGIDTPLLGYSLTKSVVNGMIGILVRQGRLSMEQPAPVLAWQNPRDPRDATTIDHLLRHTSRFAVKETKNPCRGADRPRLLTVTVIAGENRTDPTGARRWRK